MATADARSLFINVGFLPLVSLFVLLVGAVEESSAIRSWSESLETVSLWLLSSCFLVIFASIRLLDEAVCGIGDHYSRTVLVGVGIASVHGKHTVEVSGTRLYRQN